MSTATEFSQTAQEQFLDGVRQSQAAFVEAVKVWSQAVEKIVPAVPQIPVSDELPKPAEVVESSFDFAQKLLVAQRDFARNVLAAASGVVEAAPVAAKRSTQPEPKI